MRPKLRRVIPAALLAAGTIAVAVGPIGAASSAGASPRPHTQVTEYVADGAPSSGANRSCSTPRYSSIPAALAAAPSGGKVVVCGGVYGKAIVITKQVTLVGDNWPYIDAKGNNNGIEIIASGTSVSGFKIANATGEGILAQTVRDVTISDNRVLNNDRGNPKSSYPECQAQGQVPGDCGEGIHLMSVLASTVTGNLVADNKGGILVSDEFGPTAGNTISWNTVEDNRADCGITVVGHNGNAVSKTGTPQPGDAGVYSNLIEHNTVDGNGTTGEGGGILFAAAVPGAGSYANKVFDNTVWGNGLSGVTVHEHIPGQDLSGDQIYGNTIGKNDLTGDPGTGDSSTTGILLDNGGTMLPIAVNIHNNLIENDAFGIYDDTGGGLKNTNNTFKNVTTDVKT